jgi:DNA-binding NarL/FixJ family response regulator
LVRESVDAGVRGYVLKSDSDRDLIIAIEALAKHKPFFTPLATEVILGQFNTGGPIKEVPEVLSDRLTSREREILQQLAEGKDNNEVASSLGISVNTAQTHRANTYRSQPSNNLGGWKDSIKMESVSTCEFGVHFWVKPGDSGKDPVKRRGT